MESLILLGNRIIELEETPSTNTHLQSIANNEDSFEGLVVITKSQTQGKGQRGNVWQTEQGKNLTFSLLLKPHIKIDEQFLLSQLVALGVSDFLKTLTSLKVQVKWPNDIFLNGKKVAGILIENTLTSQLIRNSIVGIGLNVNQEQFDNLPFATSLKRELNTTFDLKHLLANLLKCIEIRYLQLKAGKTEQLQQQYLANLLGFNKPLQYKIAEQTVTGVIKGVNKNGKLQVEINLQLHEFDLKEISLVNC